MKYLILALVLLTSTHVEAKSLYKICVGSEIGSGCSHETFDKKTVFKIRDLFAQAPIPGQYGIWVQDAKTGQTVRGPNDPAPQEAPKAPAPTEKREKL